MASGWRGKNALSSGVEREAKARCGALAGQRFWPGAKSKRRNPPNVITTQEDHPIIVRRTRDGAWLFGCLVLLRQLGDDASNSGAGQQIMPLENLGLTIPTQRALLAISRRRFNGSNVFSVLTTVLIREPLL